MIRDITIGQYYPKDSIIHRLDARVKFVGTIIFIVSLFVFDSFWGYIPATAAFVSVVALSKIPPRFILKGLRPMLVLLIFMMLFNLFLTPGTTVLFSFWKITVTKEGVLTAVFMGVRLVLLLLGSSMMTYTTTPTALTAGMESLFGFLKVFRVPVHEVAMMMSIALRFIPILLEETDKIMKAQQARGADFENGNIFKRAKALLPILVPLFISAFRRAGDLAQAMEARCYHGGDGRTKLNPMKLKGRDIAGFIVLAAYLAGMIMIP